MGVDVAGGADLRQFQKNVDFMLREQFSDNTKRSPAAYAEGLRLFQMILDDAVDKAQEEAEERGGAPTEMDLELMPVNPNTICFASDVRISLLPNPHDSKDAFVTRVCFPSWKDFIYMDLYRGLAAGNLPYICENCHRYFLVRGCYKTVFCERIAPGETKKTCRQVGGHVSIIGGGGPSTLLLGKVYDHIRNSRGKVRNSLVFFLELCYTAFVIGSKEEDGYAPEKDFQTDRSVLQH